LDRRVGYVAAILAVISALTLAFALVRLAPEPITEPTPVAIGGEVRLPDPRHTGNISVEEAC
jgi:hypothetical protein